MQTQALDDLLDGLVAEFSERMARGQGGDGADLLARLPEEHRDTLARCFRMMRAGMAAAPRASAMLGPGVVLGGFEIERELGRGGMAIVYLAKQLELNRKVALKVMRPGLALETRHVDRFKREALAAARLQHPHIVQVYAVGETHGYHWLAMEYVDGRSLAQVYEQLPPPAERTAEHLARLTGTPREQVRGQSFERALAALLTPVARALAVTHDLGIVHRDVKPSNILITKDGRALVADFGLAKGDGDPGVSLTGEPLGTPTYMSPEQATLTTNRVDQRTDVYSFGVTLYEGLAGRCPFTGETVMQVLDALRTQTAPSIRALNRAVTTNAEAVVRRAIARNPSDRYFSAMELAADVSALANGATSQASIAEGGPLRRAWRGFRSYWRCERREFKSQRTFLGLPLVHIHSGRLYSGERMRVAKGWIAIGDVAIGGLALGGMSIGIFSFGGMAAGLFCFGGLALGALALGGVSAGLCAFGGFSVGVVALGGYAYGYYALGGGAHGAHVLSHEVRDPEAVSFFRALASWFDAVGLPGAFERLLKD